MIDTELQKALGQALREAQECGDLPQFEVPQDIPVERPRQSAMGDFATPVCMQLARIIHLPPIKVAEAVARHLPKLEFIGQVEVAHPGFINFRLSHTWLVSQVEVIRSAPGTYGNVSLGQGRKVQVEFVSANPTGPLHIGSARNAALGDALASILEAVGYEVQREYYVNDAGNQVRVFG
jgi:arginyl-tRNA synthetase